MIPSNSKQPIPPLCFLTSGYVKHPRYNLWAHEGCSYFLNAYGRKLTHTYSPSSRARKQNKRGYVSPNMRRYDSKNCHILMGEIFYGERPTFIDRHGKPYVGICHHLIEDVLNYSPENLLCWLTREQHVKADKRRRALEALISELIPGGDLHLIPYGRLRYLQDPRVLSDTEFQTELDTLRKELTKHPLVKSQPLDPAAEPNKYC